MCEQESILGRKPLSARPLVLLGGLFALLQMGANLNSTYGYFIDEFYYLSCAARPAFGYVDHPPLAVWVLALIRPVLGSSIFAIRLLPALAGGLTVVTTGLLAQRHGDHGVAGRQGPDRGEVAGTEALRVRVTVRCLLLQSGITWYSTKGNA